MNWDFSAFIIFLLYRRNKVGCSSSFREDRNEEMNSLGVHDEDASMNSDKPIGSLAGKVIQ